MTTITTPAVPCTLPDCDGFGHNDGEDRFCSATIAEIDVVASEISLQVSVEVYDATWTEGPQVSVLGLSGKWDEAFLHRATDPAEVIALAERFEELADGLRRSAVALAGLRARTAVAR